MMLYRYTWSWQVSIIVKHRLQVKSILVYLILYSQNIFEEWSRESYSNQAIVHMTGFCPKRTPFDDKQISFRWQHVHNCQYLELRIPKVDELSKREISFKNKDMGMIGIQAFANMHINQSLSKISQR